MAHQVVVTEEHYVFKPETRKKLFILLIVGAVLFALGLVLAMSGAGHHEETKGGHAALQNSEFVASVQQHAAASEGHAPEHHETPAWKKRLFSSLWMNNVFFAGMGIIGLFFVAIQYAAQAGWSVGVKRIGIAMGTWIPIAGILMLILWFVTNHDIFHWTHNYLYGEKLTNGQPNPQYDSIINNKAPCAIIAADESSGFFNARAA